MVLFSNRLSSGQLIINLLGLNLSKSSLSYLQNSHILPATSILKCSCRRAVSFSHREALMRKKIFDLSGLNFLPRLISCVLHQVPICGTHVLPLRQFWNTFQAELVNEKFRQGLRMSEDTRAAKVLLFLPKSHPNKAHQPQPRRPLAGHVSFDKTRELIARKYYWPLLREDVESLYQRMQRLFGHPKRSAQALRWTSVIASTNSSLERRLDGLCDRATHLS